MRDYLIIKLKIKAALEEIRKKHNLGTEDIVKVLEDIKSEMRGLTTKKELKEGR